MKPILQFSHANGFPASTYRQVFDVLEVHYQIRSIETIGHHPDFPVSDNWYQLVNELIANIEQSPQIPVIGVGHSLGGILSFLAAVERPDLFNCLILLDSPVMGLVKGSLMKIAKQLNLLESLTPAHRTMSRTREWVTREDAIAHFASKKMFQKWDPLTLAAYVDGMHHRDDGRVELKFDPQVEYQIYTTLPDDLRHIRRRLQCPATLIYGSTTYAVHWIDRLSMNLWHGIKSERINGSHLFPFEVPIQTADRIHAWITHFLG